ncbi:hypothetical protein Gotur_026111, partial [Gossypium turneri]
MQVVRAYIIHLIGGVLMSDANGNMVHLMYLSLLSNLHNTRSYSWGSVVLAMLYCELCQMTDPSAMDIGGCLILLQSWTLYRMSFLASINYIVLTICFRRWSTNPGIGRSYTVSIYRLMIKNHVGEGFIWMSYFVSEIMAVIPLSAHIHSNLFNFQTMEWYHEYITIWNNRLGRIPQMDRALDLQPSLEYIQWYCEIAKPFLFGGQSMVVPLHMTRLGQPLPDLHHAPEPEAEPEPKQEVEPELHSKDSSYHPDLRGDDYFPGSSSHEYHS